MDLDNHPKEDDFGEASPPKYRSLITRGCALGLVALSVSVALWLSSLAKSGFDFTDEGHYLNSIAYPEIYKVNLPPSRFGDLLKPLYDGLGRDVGSLRQAGILTTFGFAWALCLAVLHPARSSHGRVTLTEIAMAGALACLALVYYSLGLFTPSYNLLAFQGLVLVGLGLVLADKIWQPTSLIGWISIAVGGWLVFLAKPSSAALIAVLVPTALLFAGTFSFRLASLSASAAAILLLTTSLLFDGSLQNTFYRYMQSVRMQQLLGGGHSLWSMFRLSVPLFVAQDLVAAFASAFIFLSVTLKARRSIFVNACLLGFGAIFGLSTFAIIFGLLPPGILLKFAPQNNVLFLVGLALAAYAFSRGLLKLQASAVRRTVSFAAFFAALPYTYAFGTNNEYWYSASFAGFFWVLAGGILVIETTQKYKSPLALSVAFFLPLLSVTLIDRGVQLPYRQPPDLRSNLSKENIAGQSLILSAEFSDYISSAKFVAAQAGLAPGSFVIDLTGQSGGLLFALGMRSVGLPWLIGGYSGSDTLATEVLALEECDVLADAWLLTETADDFRRLSPEIVGRFGGDVATDYEPTSTFRVPPFAGGRAVGAVVDQYLLRPIRPHEDAAEKCEAIRR